MRHVQRADGRTRASRSTPYRDAGAEYGAPFQAGARRFHQIMHPRCDHLKRVFGDQFAQHFKLRFYCRRIEHHAVERDQQENAGKQRQHGIEGAAGAGQGNAIGSGSPQHAHDNGGSAELGDLGLRHDPLIGSGRRDAEESDF